MNQGRRTIDQSVEKYTQIFSKTYRYVLNVLFWIDPAGLIKDGKCDDVYYVEALDLTYRMISGEIIDVCVIQDVWDEADRVIPLHTALRLAKRLNECSFEKK